MADIANNIDFDRSRVLLRIGRLLILCIPKPAGPSAAQARAVVPEHLHKDVGLHTPEAPLPCAPDFKGMPPR